MIYKEYSVPNEIQINTNSVYEEIDPLPSLLYTFAFSIDAQKMFGDYKQRSAAAITTLLCHKLFHTPCDYHDILGGFDLAYTRDRSLRSSPLFSYGNRQIYSLVNVDNAIDRVDCIIYSWSSLNRRYAQCSDDGQTHFLCRLTPIVCCAWDVRGLLLWNTSANRHMRIDYAYGFFFNSGTWISTVREFMLL